MSDVFLSYANADRDRAAALAELLGLRGYSVWWDRTIPPGRVFDEVIQEALGAAACVVVLWSRTSATSNWVKTEAAEGASRQVLVPAVIDDVSIPIEFRRIQAANLQDWTGDPAHPELESLIQSVERLSRGADHGAPPRLDHHAPGSLVRQGRRITLWAVAGVALLAAVVAGLFLAARMFWSASDVPASTTARGTVSPGSAGDPRAVPEVSFENAPAPRVPAPAAQETGGSPGAGAGRRLNLLTAENGGMLLAATNDSWTRTIDGKEDDVSIYSGEAVFAFRDERPARFDTFTVLVSGAGDLYLRDFELLSGNESPTGRFESFGAFRTRNMKLFKTPYQEFTFAPILAKYLKVRAIANHAGAENVRVQEFQLWGIPDAR